MKVFLTGASGLVGAAVAAVAARRGHEVIGVVGRWEGTLAGVRESLRLDLRDLGAVTAVVLERFPDAIVNCAAVSEPARCDADPATSEVLNVALPERLAQLANHLSARLVHVSSEQVFDGTRPPYSAGDPPAPLNLYGRQKWESEQRVRAAAREFAVTVRAPLLMGNSPSGRRSVHERLFADWMAGRVARLHTDEVRSVCHADNLAEVLVELCERRDIVGVAHWGGAEAVSRLALGRAIAEHFKVPSDGRIEPARLQGGPLAMTRPADLTLALAPLAGLLKTRPQRLAEQLEELRVPPPAQAWWRGL